MAYYILEKGFELCGWKGLPFGLRYPNPRYCDFFDKESYHLVYAMDGRHNINENELTDKQKKLFDRLKKRRIVLPSDGKTRLDPRQEYKFFPGIYQSGA